MKDPQQDIKDMKRSKQILIEVCSTAYHAIEREDYLAICRLLDKCDERARQARRKIRENKRNETSGVKNEKQ